MDIEPYQIYHNVSSLKIIGDVKTVLNGCVTESRMEEEVLERLMFALGAGSFSDCHCVGESIILNHIGYSTYLDEQGKLLTRHGTKSLRSPFLIGLEKGVHPSTLLQIKASDQSITLNQLFENLGEDSYGYAFVGCLLFEKLACTYLKKPPIFNESINDNMEKYWEKTEEHLNCYTYLFGVVIQEKGRNHFLSELLQKAFYVNPQEKNQGSILSHTHGVLLNESTAAPSMSSSSSMSNLKNDLRFYEHLDLSTVLGARHIFTQSVVKEGLLAVFNINDIGTV